MPFDPRKFLDFCKYLCKGSCFGDQETNTRNIISRTYYSAFLHAREYLKETQGIPFEGNAIDHKLVEEVLKLRMHRSLGSYIHSLRQDRNAADYNLNNPAIFTTDSGAQRMLYFDINDQRESIRLADIIVSQLPRP